MKNTDKVVLGADGKFSAAKKFTEVYNNLIESNQSEFLIDASQIYWVSPYTACWFAAVKDKLESAGKILHVIEPERYNALHQWHNLGISKYLGLSKNIKSLPNLPAFPVIRQNEPSYPLAGKIKDVLTANMRGVENFHKALHFAVRETIENSFEHGLTDHCYICAYSVPTKNIVRLCILDTGIGIPDSIRSSKRFSSDLSDIEAVELASEYGVSSKEEDRGIGLYLMRDVAEKNEGSLSILSGNALIEISSTIERVTLGTKFHGVVLKFVLRTKKDFYYIDTAGWEAL